MFLYAYLFIQWLTFSLKENLMVDFGLTFSHTGLLSASKLCMLPSTDASLNYLDFCSLGVRYVHIWKAHAF